MRKEMFASPFPEPNSIQEASTDAALDQSKKSTAPQNMPQQQFAPPPQAQMPPPQYAPYPPPGYDPAAYQQPYPYPPQPQPYPPPQYAPPQMPYPNAQKVEFTQFDVNDLMQQKENINLIMDVPLEVTVELGRTVKTIKEILEFAPSSIIELDKLAGEPIDILVNGKFIAKGEVLVIDENFGIRITDIINVEHRI
jgi:flagellar motor switch protein FliN/FliY